MAWFKVDDRLYSHPKWAALSKDARALWVTAGSYSAAHLLDGYVPSTALPLLSGSRSTALRLVSAGLWVEAEGGYQFHDWDQYQPSRADVEERRAKAAERVRDWRAKKAKEEGEKDGTLRAV